MTMKRNSADRFEMSSAKKRYMEFYELRDRKPGNARLGAGWLMGELNERFGNACAEQVVEQLKREVLDFDEWWM